MGTISFFIVWATTGEAEVTGSEEFPVPEKSLFTSVTHWVKDPVEVADKV